MTFNEEKFVRSRHWFWAAVILMLGGILYMGLAPAAEAPLKMEWRAIAFIYENSEYKRVTDVFDHALPDELTCVKASVQAMHAMAPSFKDGDAVVIKCMLVPVLKPSVTT
jgi:hypothetical protein